MNIRTPSRSIKLSTLVLVVGALGIGAAMASQQGTPDIKAAHSRASTDPPIPPRGKLGQELFLAIDHRDLAGVKNLIEQGADPNARNGLEFTPLYIAAASHQLDVMQALLNAGAQVDADSTYGTALTFACGTGHLAGAKLLISLGADVNVARTDGITPLMMAANVGSAEIVSALLEKHADPKEIDRNRTSALIYAARNGATQAGMLLLDAGAEINAADKQGRTALMGAAMNGHADLVRELLARGANPGMQDASGRTALDLSCAYGDYPDVVRALAERGRGDNKAAAAVALNRGHIHAAEVLGEHGGGEAAPTRTPRVAVSASLKLLTSSMLQFKEMTACVSCHQEGLGRITTGIARRAGLPIDRSVDDAQVQRIDGMLNALKPLHQMAVKSPAAMKQVPLIEINEVSTLDGWLLAGMAEHGQAPTDATAAMAGVLARQQSPDGSWTFSVPRMPMQSSRFTFTALAIRALKTYGSKAEAAENAKRIKTAAAWLSSAPVQTSEDRAFRLLGLRWAGAKPDLIQTAARAIRADQGKDGGWSQLPSLQSDAYATGEALYALHEGAGVSVSEPAYRRGVDFLLRTQDEDGSWFVNKRAYPANNYFDAGFPHGQSQYASFNGTCWATIALIESLKR